MNKDDIKTFDWDDEIEKESEFTLLDEGDYDFEIVSFERGQYDGSNKMPPCKMAIVSFRVTDGTNDTVIQDRFYLASNMEWKLSQLFKSVGLKSTGQKVAMNWNALPGKKGRCHVIVRKNDQGNDFNNISKLYAKDEGGDDAWN